MPWRSRVEELKDLSGSTTVNRLGDLEMFHFVQHDNQLIPNNIILNAVNAAIKL